MKRSRSPSQYLKGKFRDLRRKIKQMLRESRLNHRDYKRIEVASGDESGDKLNKANGGQIEVPDVTSCDFRIHLFLCSFCLPFWQFLVF